LTKKSVHNIGYDELVRSRFNLIIVYHYSECAWFLFNV